jgi:hypothetical protein
VKLFNPFRRVKEKYLVPGLISIDNAPYHVIIGFSLHGSTLRYMACVADDRDLWIESSGLEQDVKVEDWDNIRLSEGMRFFSTPRYINNG